MITKKQIREATTMELALRFNCLILIGETVDAKDISVADAKELIWIEDELHKRIIKVIGHDFYPPPRLEKPPQSNTIKSLLKPTDSKSKTDSKINFKVVVFNCIGSKAIDFNVKANSKDQADIMARKMIRKLGISGATFKIS